MGRLICCLLLAASGAFAVAGADSGPLRRDYLTAELLLAQQSVAPGSKLQVALRLVHDEHWHTYWANPGDSGLATRLDWTLHPGAVVEPIRWPMPKRLPIGPLVNFGYEAELLLPQEISIPASLAPGERFVAAVKASWLVCKEECIPGDASFAVALPVEREARADSNTAGLVIAALAAEPPRSDSLAQYARVGDSIVAHLPPIEPALDPNTLEVFPLQQQVLANSRGEVQPAQDGGWRIVTPLSDAFDGLPASLELWVTDGPADGRRAFRVLARLADTLPAAVANAPGSTAGVAEGPGGLWAAFALAMLGGVLLNLMPCVFPVLALKAMGLAEQGGAHPRAHGLAYLAGVLASFAALAGALLALRAGGEQLGWGFQLQLPWVVGALALLMLAMGLSLSGVFEFGGRWMGAGQSLADRDGLRGAFFTGVLAVVVASPCTAPFMGPALGYAVTQPAPIALAVFLALGFGLAAPLLVVSWWPTLARRLPRPGPWMSRFRQAMAFPMYLTAVWLLWVLGRQAGADALAQVLAGAVALAFAAWLLGQSGGIWRRAGILLGLAGAVASLGFLPSQGENARFAMGDALWEPWSPERVAALRAEGRPVLVNMTAAWCITCLANERIALSSEAFRGALARNGVAYLKGDWTQRDPRITAYLGRYGRNGVPIYVLYPRGDGPPEVLPQLLTPALVDAALMRAARP